MHGLAHVCTHCLCMRTCAPTYTQEVGITSGPRCPPRPSAIPLASFSAFFLYPRTNGVRTCVQSQNPCAMLEHRRVCAWMCGGDKIKPGETHIFVAIEPASRYTTQVLHPPKPNVPHRMQPKIYEWMSPTSTHKRTRAHSQVELRAARHTTHKQTHLEA